MTFLVACLFGAGVAAFIYTKAGNRVGFANTQRLWVIVGVVFALATMFFWSILWGLGIKF